MTTGSTTLLAGVLRQCASEEGGIRALCRAIGISPQTLYGLLGGRSPGRHVTRAIAAYLEMPAGSVAAWATPAKDDGPA